MERAGGPKHYRDMISRKEEQREAEARLAQATGRSRSAPSPGDDMIRPETSETATPKPLLGRRAYSMAAVASCTPRFLRPREALSPIQEADPASDPEALSSPDRDAPYSLRQPGPHTAATAGG